MILFSGFPLFCRIIQKLSSGKRQDVFQRTFCMLRRFAGCLFVNIGRPVLAPLVAGRLFQRGLTGGLVVAPFVVILLRDHAVGEAHGLPVPELKQIEQVHVGVERAIKV